MSRITLITKFKEKDIKNLKESIEKGLEILNRKTNWKEENYFFSVSNDSVTEINTLGLSLIQMSLLSSSRKSFLSQHCGSTLTIYKNMG